MENKQSLNDFMTIHISAHSIQNGKFESSLTKKKDNYNNAKS